MNVYYKLIGVSVLSLAGGVYIGYRLGLNKAQKMADEQVNDTKVALRNYYENKIEEVKEDKAKENEDLGVDPGINDVAEVLNKSAEAASEARDRFPGSNEKVQSISRADNVVNEPEKYPDPEDKTKEPYMITEKEYGELDNWDTLDLILWKCGTVTTDDARCDVVSPTLLLRLLPEKWPDMFSYNGKYVDTIYFRNNKERRDVQIIKDNRTYREWMEEVYPGRLDELDE